MNRYLSIAVPVWTILASLLAGPSASAAESTCLNVRDIVSSAPNDQGSAILFKMRDGKTWRNDLIGRCPDLRFEGFEWVVHGPELVCENEQTLRVLRTGEICELGKFTQVTPDKKT